MIRTFEADKINLKDILNRDIMQERGVDQIVDDILDNVRQNGDAALLEYTKRFDRAELDCLRVSEAEIEAAFSAADPYFVETLELARQQIEDFHRRQIPGNFIINDRPGIVLGQKVTPIEKAGLYVPGGTAA